MREPYFVVEPVQDLVVEEGNDLSIACDINGEPEPEG